MYPVRRVRRRHRYQAGNVLPGDVAQGGVGEESGTAHIDQHGVGSLVDGAVEHVGVNLAPQIGAGPAAHHNNGVEPLLGELLDISE